MSARRSKAEPPAPSAPAWAPWAWAALFLALALVPDQKLLRAKLISLEAGLLLLAAAWLWRAYDAAAPSWRRTPLDKAVLAYVAAGLAFYVLSPEPRNSEGELSRILFSAAAFFAASQTLDPDARLPRLAWAAGAAAAGAWALAARLGWLAAASGRPEASFGNPIFLGSFLAASLPITIALWPGSDKRERGLLLLAIALQLAGLWLSQSRAALGGLLAAGLLWAVLRQRGTERLLALAALAATGVALLAHFWSRTWTHGLIWEGAWKLWLAHPVLGCGLGRFHMEFPAYAPAELKSLWPQDQMIVNYAHNEYLQNLAETGPLGLLAFAALPLSALRLLLRQDDLSPAAKGPAYAALALFATAAVSPDLRFGASSFVAFASLGALAAAAGELRPIPASPARALSLAPAALLLAFWAKLAVRPILAFSRLRAAPDFHASTPDTTEAIVALERALAADPKSEDAAEKLGYLYAKEKAWDQARDRYELAARLAPFKPGPANNLGNLHYIQGDKEQAIEWWQRSLAAEPRQKDARINLGKTLYEMGRLKESAAQLEKALELDPNDEKARVLLKKMVE